MFISLLFLSFTLNSQVYAFFDSEKPVLIAKQREIVIPEKAKGKGSCKEVRTELISTQKTLLGLTSLVRKNKLTAENDNQLENKKAQNEVKLAREKANRLMKLYKSEESKPTVDTYNASVDAALEAREKAFSAALKTYKAELDRQLKMISGRYVSVQKSLKKIVCTGKILDDRALARAYSRGEGLVASRSEFNNAVNVALQRLRFVARAANNSVFKTGLRDAEKTRNDALKPLKKVK